MNTFVSQVMAVNKTGGVIFLMKLSARLQVIADELSLGCRMADIGSDHALLPVYAVKNGKASFAVAGEVNDGPYEAARRQVAEAGEQSRISVRKGDGLAVINPGEVDAITIAGMGGALIVSILASGIDKLTGVKRLVLQPNVGEEFVRSWLIENGWYLEKEQILEEDGKIYEVLTAVADPGAEALNEQLYQDKAMNGSIVISKPLLLRIGPRFIMNPSPILLKKWQGEIAKLEKICRQVALSDQEASRERESELRQEIEQLKEVLACWQKDRP